MTLHSGDIMKTAQDIRRDMVGKPIRKAREQNGLTQWDIAKGMEYTSAQFVSNWERGVSMPPLAELPRVASLVGLTTKELKDRMKACKIKEIELEFKDIK